MRDLFQANTQSSQDAFHDWVRFSNDRLAPLEHQRLSDDPFHAHVTGTNLRGLDFSQSVVSDLRVAATGRTIRHNKYDRLWASIMLKGSVAVEQDGHFTVDHVGDLSIRDTNVRHVIDYVGPITCLKAELPRRRVEDLLGPACLYSCQTVDAALPSTILARSFLLKLTKVQDQLSADTARRMASIAIDLVVASIAEHMALDTPRPLQGTVIVQRAKAYIEANLGDTGLDPPRVAAAMGISLRHLQGLFSERGRSVFNWIWQQRLDLAANRLADPMGAGIRIGELAYRCGFVSQAHFARRFHDRFGVSPRDYRRAAFARSR